MLLCLPLYFFPSLPLTHPLCFPFSLKPTLGAEKTYMPNNYETQFSERRSLPGWPTEKASPTGEFPPTFSNTTVKKTHNAHGAGDDIRSVHHNVRIHLKVQLSPRETEADSLQVRPLKAEPKTWQCGAEDDKLSVDVRKWPPWRGLTLWIWGTTCSSFLRSFEKCGLYSLCWTNGAHCVLDLTEVWCFHNTCIVQPGGDFKKQLAAVSS